MAVDIDVARLLDLAAAAAPTEQEPDAPVLDREAPCLRDGGAVSEDAVQIFGGYGFIDEYPVGKYLRDARARRSMRGRARYKS